MRNNQIVNQEEIKDYIRKSKEADLDEITIKSNLLQAGCKIAEIGSAFSSINLSSPPTPEPKPLEQTKNLDQPPLKASSPPSAQSLKPILQHPTPKPQKALEIPSIDKKLTLPFFSREFYLDILHGKEHLSAFLFLIIIALINTIKPAYYLIKAGYPIVNNLGEKVELIIDELYPEDLEIKIKSGYASVNVPEPYYVNVPKETLNLFLPLEKTKQIPVSQVRLLAIDTKGKAEDFENYQSLALLTETSLVYYGDEKVNIQSLRNIQDLTINKKFLQNKFLEFNPSNRIEVILKIALTIGPLVIVLFMLIISSFSFLLLSLLMWLIIKINQLSVRFSKVFTYMVAISFLPALILTLIAFITPFNFMTQSEFLSSMIFLGLAYSLMVKKENISEYA